jgi:hypothetical protein
MDPAEVAARVIQAIKDRQFWILTHPEYLDSIQRRNQHLHTLTNPTVTTDFTSNPTRS